MFDDFDPDSTWLQPEGKTFRDVPHQLPDRLNFQLLMPTVVRLDDYGHPCEWLDLGSINADSYRDLKGEYVGAYVSRWCGNSAGHWSPQGSRRNHQSWGIPRDNPIETRTHVQRVREPGYVMVRFQVARISAEKTREQVSYIVTSRRAGEWRYSQRERITTRWFELTTPPSRVFDLQKQDENPD